MCYYTNLEILKQISANHQRNRSNSIEFILNRQNGYTNGDLSSNRGID